MAIIMINCELSKLIYFLEVQFHHQIYEQADKNVIPNLCNSVGKMF